MRFGGSARTFAAAVQPPSSGGFGGFDQTLLRVTVNARPTRRLAFEGHLVQAYSYSPFGDTSGPAASSAFGAPLGAVRYRAIDATTDWYTRGNQVASLWVDRLNVKLTLPGADVTIGRQAISFGKAYFWNPLDEFLPQDARQIDRDYKAGVDAVRIDVPTGPFSGVTLVAGFGREVTPFGAYEGGDRAVGASWYGSALLARDFTTVHDWDLAGQAGKVYGGYEVGGGAVGEVHGIEVRGEAAYVWSTRDAPLAPPLVGALTTDHLSAVAGVGKRFSDTLSIELEHLHNGAGELRSGLDAALARFTNGASLSLGRETTGATVSYDVLPIATVQIAALHSWSDGSTEVQPTLSYSLSANSDLMVGAAVGLGAAPVTVDTTTHLRSEFGSYPRAYFVELKRFF